MSNTTVSGASSTFDDDDLSVSNLVDYIQTLTDRINELEVINQEEVRVIRAADTMHLSRFYASQALVEEAKERDDLRVIADPEPIEFDGGQFTAASPQTT